MPFFPLYHRFFHSKKKNIHSCRQSTLGLFFNSTLERFLVVLEFWPEIRNSRCVRMVRHERLSLTLETPNMENVIKTQLYEELFIVVEADIFYWLVIEQTWIAQLLLNLERSCHIPRFAGFTENIVPQFDNKKFLRHFRVSPESF